MKTTIKLDALHAIVLQPNADKTALRIDLTTAGVTAITKTLTIDQADAMRFGIEEVLNRIAAQAESKKRLRCHDADAAYAAFRADYDASDAAYVEAVSRSKK